MICFITVISMDKIKPVVFLLVVFLLTRAVLVTIGIASITYLPMITGDEYRHLEASPALDMWYRWDAGFYTAIAVYGYQWTIEHKPTADMAFLPLYPSSIRTINQIFKCSDIKRAVISGLLISNIALLVSVYLLFDIVSSCAGSKVAYHSVGLLLLSPNSIFLSGVYTESLFLCLSLIVFQSIRKEQFYIAVLAASLACFTRTVGLSLYLPLVLYSWKQSGRLRVIQLLLSHIPLVVFGAYIALTGFTAGDWLAYFSANAQIWQRTVLNKPWEVFTIYFSGGEDVSLWGWRLSWIDLLFTAFYLFLSLVVLVKNRSWGVFALIATLIPVSSGTLVSMPRYGSVVFPFYVVLAEWAGQRKHKQVLVYSGSILLLILFTARFTTWHWIA